MADFDSPWKEALDHFFEQFMAFFFPKAHADIDWSRGHEPLDKELSQVVREAEIGRKVVDKLVRVWQPNGPEKWVLVHVEVQAQAEADFGRRMYVYNYRLFDRYNREVASMAVLADDQPDWRPTTFGYSLWDCTAGIEFPAPKLLDYVSHEAELEVQANPFAVTVLAHLKTLETRSDAASPQRWKMRLVRSLYERGFGKVEVARLFRFIDWLMDLPEDLDKQFWQDLQRFEEDRKAPFITSVERIGYQRGHPEGQRQGLLEALELGLQLRFGVAGLALLPQAQALADLAKLRSAVDALKAGAGLDELRQLLS
jgi:hypothetical protein